MGTLAFLSVLLLSLYLALRLLGLAEDAHILLVLSLPAPMVTSSFHQMSPILQSDNQINYLSTHQIPELKIVKHLQITLFSNPLSLVQGLPEAIS